ncbi:MAG: hypothetical protein OXN89_05000 [Bryobacterales bacterium]|nr:hypothetical protein [Bryobacterales bacterium]
MTFFRVYRTVLIHPARQPPTLRNPRRSANAECTASLSSPQPRAEIKSTSELGLEEQQGPLCLTSAIPVPAPIVEGKRPLVPGLPPHLGKAAIHRATGLAPLRRGNVDLFDHRRLLHFARFTHEPIEQRSSEHNHDEQHDRSFMGRLRFLRSLWPATHSDGLVVLVELLSLLRGRAKGLSSRQTNLDISPTLPCCVNPTTGAT